jgi:ABC-type microcin C transport system permease subunit YejE
VSKRVHAGYESRESRFRRNRWLRLGVWIFLIIFAFSVVGGIFVFSASSK